MVDIRRVERLLEKTGERLIERTFTQGEQEYAESKALEQRVAIYAKRFAAKEAFSKAMGTGIGANVGFTDVEVRNDANGKPELVLHGVAAKWMEKHHAIAHVSLSDEPPYAIAQVIIEVRSAAA